MDFRIDRNLVLSDKDIKREKIIIERLHLKKLPFSITAENFCSRYIEMFNEMRPFFKSHEGEYAMKWCFTTEKKMRVFLLIFEANEMGNEMYKESVSSLLPEYSYKTIAQIIDEGVAKGYFIKLEPRARKTNDSKIRNIRPSENLTVEFINWNIDLLATANNFLKKYN